MEARKAEMIDWIEDVGGQRLRTARKAGGRMMVEQHDVTSQKPDSKKGSTERYQMTGDSSSG